MKKAADYFVVISGLIFAAAVAHAEVEPIEDPVHDMPHGEIGSMMFKSMDANGDGVVSKAELSAFSAKYFKKMDANNDGKLTPDEMHGGHQQMPNHNGMKHLDERFNAANTNHDGGIDREEAKAMPMLSAYFDVIDADKNGKITRQEYLDAMPMLHRGKHMDSSGNSQSM